jgi:hypothetical protein
MGRIDRDKSNQIIEKDQGASVGIYRQSSSQLGHIPIKDLI